MAVAYCSNVFDWLFNDLDRKAFRNNLLALNWAANGLVISVDKRVEKTTVYSVSDFFKMLDVLITTFTHKESIVLAGVTLEKAQEKQQKMRVTMQDGKVEEIIFTGFNDYTVLVPKTLWGKDVDNYDLGIECLKIKSIEFISEFSGQAIAQADLEVAQILNPLNLIEELEESGLSERERSLLRQYSKGVMMVYDFIEKISRVEKGYSLGFTGNKNIYDALSTMKNFSVWEDAYKEFSFDPTRTDQTDKFLNRIAAERKPIVFFMPRDVFRDSHGVTAAEVRWFLNHPEMMRDVYFVFGAYESISNDDHLRYISRAPEKKDGSFRSLNERIELMKQILLNFKIHMKNEKLAQESLSSVISKPPGGIDFRFLPIVTQSIGSLKASIGTISQATLRNINLAQEWGAIERLVNSGITPSAERLKEYLAASCFKGELSGDLNKIVSCIADILRMQEESCCVTDPILKDMLVVLGSGRSAEELKLALVD